MYALHFMFGVGALLSPLLARPFLREASLGAPTSWQVLLLLSLLLLSCGQVWEVRTLYPLVALAMLTVIPGYLVYWVRERRLEAKLRQAEQVQGGQVQTVSAHPAIGCKG